MIRLRKLCLLAWLAAIVPMVGVQAAPQSSDSQTTEADAVTALRGMFERRSIPVLEPDPADLGIAAPELDITSMVKGTTVSLAEGRGEKIHVVEFWATWCPPCIDSIPHLTKLQAEYMDKGVVFVGITDEKESVVRPFVTKQGANMEYNVAIDNNEKTSDAYMKPFGVQGIPHAFIVDKEGRVAWRGHPMAQMDKALDEILAGTYDIDKTNRLVKAKTAMRNYFRVANSDPERARQMGEQVMTDGGSDHMLVGEFAWRIATTNSLKNPDLDLALRAAKLAVEGSNSEEPLILDAYARVQFARGETEEAIKYQRMAIEKSDDSRMTLELQKTLNQYEAAKSTKE